VTDTPTTAIYDLIRTQFDRTQVTLHGTTLGDRPEIHTGRHSRSQLTPAIAIHSQDGGPVDGGTTGATAFNGDGSGGGVMQVRSGTLTVNLVAGTREDTASLGANGMDLNPKALRGALDDHIQAILLDNYATPPDPLRTVSPGSATDIERTSDEEDVDPEYIRQLRANYTRYRG